MKLKKGLAALIMSGLMAFTMFAMVGCQDNSEQVIRDSLTQEFESLQNPDAATLSEITASLPKSTFAQLGLNVNDVAAAMLEGFNGTVDSVTVNGNTADAVVTVTSKDFGAIEEAMSNLSSEMMSDTEQFADMSMDEIYAWAAEQIMTSINDTPVTTHDPITLQYERNGNTWAPTSGAQSELYATIFG